MCTLALLLALGTSGFECPESTEPRHRTTVEARESWCERPGGVRHGPRHAWHAEGSKWFEGSYDDGKREGPWRFWFQGGAKRSESVYRNDRRHGAMIQWYESGVVHVKGVCQEGVEHGTWERFQPNASKEARATFEKGKLVAAQYWSRRGLPIDINEFVIEKARAKPGDARHDRALAAYQKNAGFDACGE